MKTTGFNHPPLVCAAFMIIFAFAFVASAEKSIPIPVPALHLDAGNSDSIVLDDEESVLEWSDAAGSAGRFVPPGEPPRFVSDSINGRPAIHFGAGSFLVGSSAAAPVANGVAGLTVVSVVKNEGEGAQNIVRIGGGHSVAALRFMLGRRSSDWRLVARRVDQGDLQNLAGGSISTGAWAVVSGGVDFENATAALAIDGTEVNASEFFLDSGTATASDSLMFRIGNDHQEQYWQGSIAEILVYDRALSTAERQAVEMYLTDKYGLKDEQGGEGGEFGARDAFRVTPGGLPNDGVLFVNHEAGGRSGHGGHAITEASNGDIIAFYSNVSGEAFSYLAKRIRNPQVSGQLGGLYFMHGRSGQEGDDPRHLVLYSSENAIDWDEGIFLNRGSSRDLDSYSTNAIIGRLNSQTPERLLIQSSIAYDQRGRRVNIHHWWIDLPEQVEP